LCEKKLLTWPVDVPTAKFNPSRNFKAVTAHFFPTESDSNKESKEQSSRPACLGCRGSQHSTTPSLLPQANNSFTGLNSQQLFSTFGIVLSEVLKQPCSKLNRNISSLQFKNTRIQMYMNNSKRSSVARTLSQQNKGRMMNSDSQDHGQTLVFLFCSIYHIERETQHNDRCEETQP